MLKSHSIRSAVKLCVTVALLLSHGGFTMPLASACQPSASTVTKCEGCGHCDVDSKEERCGCCSKKSRQATYDQKSPRKKSCCSKSTASDVSSAETKSQGIGACFCGQDTPPIIPQQTRSDVQQILKLTSTYFSSPITPEVKAVTWAASAWPELRFVSSLESQQLLCIWRI